MSELVSVIIPVYQTRQYLKKCLESVLNQDYQNLEIILVDDGSTDGSEVICDEFAARDSRIKVIHDENKGLSHARNMGIDASKGEYIAFLDSDDMIGEQFVSYLLKLCKLYDAEISQCDFLMVRDETDALLPQKKEHIVVYSPENILSKTYDGFESVRYVVVWNKLYKRSVVEQIRFPEGKIHEDSYTTHKIFWNAKKIVVSNLYLYLYVQRSDSIVGKKYSVDRLDSVEASRIKCDFFKENGMEQEYYDMLVQHYHNLWRNYFLVKKNIENADEILRNMELEAEQVKNKILNASNGVLLEKLRTIYPYLPDEEKKYYTNVYGNRITYTWKAFFRFPSDIIQKHSRIAIFGAGGVGKSYYEQIKDDPNYHLVLWVDNLWSNYVKEGYDVKPIKELLRTQYDCILLAVQNQRVADEIRENLVSWGVDSEKIVWDFPDDRQGRRKELNSYSDMIMPDGQRKLILMNTADYGNIGDQALAIQGISFLRSYFPEFEIIEVSGRQWDITKDLLKQKISDLDILLFVGGGYMGDLWPMESDRVKEMIHYFPENKKVFFPQSFFYSSNKADLCIDADRKFFGEYENILFIHREEQSYELMSNRISVSHTNLLFPDMALYGRWQTEKCERKGVTGCFRLDKEKVNTDINERTYEVCVRRNIPYKVIDTLVDHTISRKEREGELQKLLEEFRHTELVITDRLHGMLFCAVTGTPCLAIDNISHKVSGVYKWIEKLDFIKIIYDIANIENQMEQFLAEKGNKYIMPDDFPDDEFDLMALKIKDWCGI